MTRPISVRLHRTVLPSVLFLLCAWGLACHADGQAEMPGPAAEPADILSREYATGNWAGLRDQLKKRGVSFDLRCFGDYSHNFQGGLKRGDALRHLVNFNIVLDTERLLGWKGGTFFAGAQTFGGENASEKLTGDLQGFDNIDSGDFTQISEVWYEQKLLDDKLRLKIGKVDANSEFAYVEYGGEFIHSSAGFSPTIQGFPTYPDPATCVLLFVEPVEWCYLGLGVFDGATQDGSRGRTGNRGPSTFWGDPSDLFLIGEVGFKWSLRDETLPGRVGVGIWRHTGSFERFAGGSEDGTAGAYLVLDQLLWRENSDAQDEQGIGAFFQYGWADPKVSEVNHHFGAGLAWSGAIPTRDNDVLGVMASYAHFSDEPAAGFSESGELSIEMFYKVQITPWFSVKPDLQYIMNPGGADLDDALVLTIRAELAF